MRHFRSSNAILETLVDEHEKQGFIIRTTDRGVLAIAAVDDEKHLSINLTVIAQALWEKWS